MSTGSEIVDVPLTVIWYPTGCCDYRCSYCWYQKQDIHPSIDISEYEDVMRELSDIRRLRMTFTGGEPTSHPMFNRMLAIGCSMCDKIKVNSNMLRGAAPFEGASPEIVTVCASYHPEFVSYQTYISSVMILLSLGFEVIPAVVMLDGLRTEIESFLDRTSQDIPSINVERLPYFNAVTGKFEPFGERPDGVASEPHTIHHEGWKEVSGRLCRAGMDMIAIMPDGEIQRCVNNVRLFGDHFPIVRLSDIPLPCTSSQGCVCAEMNDYWKSVTHD
jgi:hypothetical protein